MLLFVRAGFVAAFSLSCVLPAAAADSNRLAKLAAVSGYTYEWLATESGVSLQRPGVIIVLHAGYPLYEVNGTPIQADRPPRFENGDLVVSPALAQRLRRIAISHPRFEGSTPIAALPPGAQHATPAAPSGAITLHMKQIQGREALLLSGTAAANDAITITLTGELSNDLPSVILNRYTVMTADDGSYSLSAGIGQQTHRGTTIAASAKSSTGATSAVARIVVDAPNFGVNSSLDRFPPK